MIFSGTTPNNIYEWIDKKNNGDDTDYLNGKQDTEEAIDVFQTLYRRTFKNVYRLFLHLHQYLCMRVADSKSLYRAFIILRNDEIITFRLSQHFSTKDAAKKAFKRTGKPNVEYHLTINRVKPLNPNTDIYYDRMLSNVEIKVREYDLSEFNDRVIRKGIIDEIITLLTYGTNKNENKHYMNMNKQLIRLTEDDLHNIVKDAVNRILKEGEFEKWAAQQDKKRCMQPNIDQSKYPSSANPTVNETLEEYTGNFGYTDDNAPSNRPAIGTPEYYRRNDRMQIGQEPIYNNARNWDDPNYNRKENMGFNAIGNSSHFNTNRGWQTSNSNVEESTVNEVMYNGRSYHGNNADDWADLADKRETRQFNLDPNVGTKVGKMNAQDMLNHAKNGVDFSKLTIDDGIDSKGNVHKDMNNMTPEEWRQWTKNGAARLRNWGNYHATRSDYTPNKRKEYSQEDYQKAKGWNDYRNRGFNSALQQWNS